MPQIYSAQEQLAAAMDIFDSETLNYVERADKIVFDDKFKR